MFKHLSNYFIIPDSPETTVNNQNLKASTSSHLENLFTTEILPPNELSDESILQIAEEYACSNLASTTHPLPNKFELIEINQAIKELWNQIDTIYDFIKPQTITIHNFQCLKINSAVESVKEKVDSLFFDALIPLNWKSTVTWTEKTDKNEIDIVTITMINYHVKEQAVKKLTKYFDKMYNNSIYI